MYSRFQPDRWRYIGYIKLHMARRRPLVIHGVFAEVAYQRRVYDKYVRNSRDIFAWLNAQCGRKGTALGSGTTSRLVLRD